MAHTQSELDSLLQHVSDTWQLKRSLEQIQTQKHQLQADLNELMTQELSIKKELKESKKLIDHCLQTGEDATVTKLIKTTDDLINWKYDDLQQRHLNKMDDIIYKSLYSTITSSIAAKGHKWP